MLSMEIIRKIKSIHIKSSRLVNTMMAGQYKSVFRGSGIEFEEVREYSPGDDVKSIDWKVSARMGRPFVKLYREERELVLMLMVDMSASTFFGTTLHTKKEIAAEVAGILAFNAIRNNDRVGAILFTDQVERYIPPKKGAAHIWRVIKEIFTFEPGRKRTDINSAVRYLGHVCRKKTVSFLISDFLCVDFLHGMKIAANKHDLIAVMLSDPGDFTLPSAGLVTVEDFETGKTVLLDASGRNTRQLFEQRQRTRYRALLEQLKSADIDCVEISTDAAVSEALVKFFRYRSKRNH
ncbi:MAG: DUF58 domain-containing protein [Thermodesulfobacteriota bacterium]